MKRAILTTLSHKNSTRRLSLSSKRGEETNDASDGDAERVLGSGSCSFGLRGWLGSVELEWVER
jgi:hypothetical protein